VVPTPALPADISFSTGPHIFKSDLHSPHSPGFPNPALATGPAPLEPCPEPINLRPFWLLRCIYQTIANPAGGYLSNRLFVLPQVWNTRGVKLKAVDDKIVACDTLTVALTRLAQVDSFDAQAVLDEMQALESTLDAVQTTLSKKLNHDVGVSATASFIKDAPADVGPAAAALDHPPLPGANAGAVANGHSGNDARPNGTRSSSKSYLSSWRKLRSKTSSSTLSSTTAGVAGSGSGKEARGGGAGAGDEAAAAPRMASLPMTPLLNVRFTKRDASAQLVDVGGVNAGYMVSLARLCDAVQVVGKCLLLSLHLFFPLFPFISVAGHVHVAFFLSPLKSARTIECSC
jgi:hypothetical protein